MTFLHYLSLILMLVGFVAGVIYGSRRKHLALLRRRRRPPLSSLAHIIARTMRGKHYVGRAEITRHDPRKGAEVWLWTPGAEQPFMVAQLRQVGWIVREEHMTPGDISAGALRDATETVSDLIGRRAELASPFISGVISGPGAETKDPASDKESP